MPTSSKRLNGGSVRGRVAGALLAVLTAACGGFGAAGPGGMGCGEAPSEAAARCHAGPLAEGELIATVSNEISAVYLFDSPTAAAPAEAAYVLFYSEGVEVGQYHAFGGEKASGQRIGQSAAGEPGSLTIVRGNLFGFIGDDRIARLEVSWAAGPAGSPVSVEERWEAGAFSADVSPGFYLVPTEADVPLGVRLLWTFFDDQDEVIHVFRDP